MPTGTEILNFILEIIMLNIEIGFYIIEAVFRLIVPPQEKNIQGRVVLITGGGGGIGRSLALEFAKRNARIVVWDINKEAVEETAAIVQQTGAMCYSYVCDVTTKADVDRVAADVMKDVGNVDILVNNAGVFPCKTLMDLSEVEIRLTFDVNSLAIFWTTKAFLPSMTDRNSGHLVTVSSMAGKVGNALCMDYCASKSAAFGAMEAVREELDMQEYSGITCSIVCPMMVNTPMLQKFADRIQTYDRFGRLYESTFVAEQAVKRILRNELYIYIPADKGMVGLVMELMPYKARKAIFRFVSAGFKEKDKKRM